MNREERRKAEKDLRVGKIKKVGQRLPGVTLGDVNRPILEQVDEIVEQVAEQPVLSQVHLPIVAPLQEPEGAWGVACVGCSYVKGEFVYPCDKWPATPPQVLYETAPSPSEV